MDISHFWRQTKWGLDWIFIRHKLWNEPLLPSVSVSKHSEWPPCLVIAAYVIYGQPLIPVPWLVDPTNTVHTVACRESVQFYHGQQYKYQVHSPTDLGKVGSIFVVTFSDLQWPFVGHCGAATVAVWWRGKKGCLFLESPPITAHLVIILILWTNQRRVLWSHDQSQLTWPQSSSSGPIRGEYCGQLTNHSSPGHNTNHLNQSEESIVAS